MTSVFDHEDIKIFSFNLLFSPLNNFLKVPFHGWSVVCLIRSIANICSASFLLFKDLFMEQGSFIDFWQGSIFFLEPLSTDHPPKEIVYLTPILVTISIPFSYYIFLKNKSFTDNLVNGNKPFYLFLKNKWYFDELYDVLFVKSSKFLGKYLWKKIDGLVIDRFGPDGLSSLFKYFSIKAVKFQSGFIYQYAFIMLIGFSLILTIIIIN